MSKIEINTKLRNRSAYLLDEYFSYGSLSLCLEVQYGAYFLPYPQEGVVASDWTGIQTRLMILLCQAHTSPAL